MPEENILVSDPRDRIYFPLRETFLRKAVVIILRLAFKLVMRMEVSGMENLPDVGPLVVIANHLTSFDIFPLQLALTRPIFYMGKAELFAVPGLELLFRHLGGFPVRRGQRDEWAIRHAERLLQHGQVVGMFPEGTRSHGAGLRVAKTGAARLALAEKCPLLPVAIDGSQRLFKHFPRRTRLDVRICEPIHPKPNELPLGLTDRLMFALAQNLPEHLRGVYAVRPEGFE